MSCFKLSTSVLAIAALSATAAVARDQIRIVGSSTVFPYAQAVSEQFANSTGAPSPIIESTGTGGGMQIFCGGVGEGFPDLTNASRAMKKSEFDLCVKNGVTDISEALLGYDGLSIAMSRANPVDIDLTLGQVYLALGAQVPVDGKWVDNPYKKWSDIDSKLPAINILAYGPPPTSGTRDAFVELAMHVGCEGLDFVKAEKAKLDKKKYGAWVKDNCSRMRTDGPFVEAGENDNLIVQRLEADKNAVGIFGYSFLYENLDKLKDVKINGVPADLDTIADKSYPISRPLFFYVKNAHRGVIAHLNEYLDEFMSDDALAKGGYLSERGLVTLSEARLQDVRDAVLNAKPMAAPK